MLTVAFDKKYYDSYVVRKRSQNGPFFMPIFLLFHNLFECEKKC